MRIFTTKHSSGAVRRFFGVLLVLLFSTQFSVKSYAQLADAYIFSTTTSASLEEDLNSNTFSMSSGTTQLVASGVDNGRSAAQSIGFTFNFMGKNFTQFSSTSNGLVALGGSAGTGTGAISTSRYVIGTAGDTVITPFSADLQVNSTGKVHYKLIGSSPNQVLVIEFQNMEIYWSSSTADGTYQVRLYEGSNTIEFVYGAMSVGATFTTGHTGFSYGSTPGQFFSVNTSTHATSTSSIIANAYSSTGAISGLTSSSNGSRRSYVFKQKQNDAGIASIASPTSPLSAGAQNVAVNVKNFGFKTLTSGTINWTVNGVSQTARNFSGKSITTGTTDTVNLGSYTFSAGTTYVVKAWTSNPNATTDESAVNDTLVFTFYPPLSGTYNIGNNGDFSTLTNAVNALNSAGVSGPVTFLLKDATYTTAEVFPIVINQVAGASATNRITIRPAANNTATISGSSATSIIKLNGADFVTIDGSNTRGGSARNLTINNTSTGTSTAAIWVASLGTDAGAKLDTIKNLNISTGSNTVTSTFGIHLGGTSISTSGTGADNDTLTIQNNLITKAYYAIYARGVTTTGLLDGLVITQNIIGSANTTDYVTFRGIDLAQTSNALISKNTIFNIKITTGTTVAAIDLGANNNNARVSQNYISGVNSPSSSGWGAYGINVSSTTNTGITIDNNMISDILAANYYLSPGITFSAFGIRLTGGTGYKIYNNSVHLSGAPANGTAGTISAAFVVTTTTAANFSGDIRNNTFSNVMGGVTGAKSYAIYLASYSATTTTYNYNNYYAGGTYGILGYLTSDRTSLSAWQTATTQDANSVNNNPSFRSATDLHVKALSSSLDAKGVAISGFTTDFDGQTRNSSTPDIGADEYETLSNDLNIVSIYKPTGNVCGDSNTVLSIIITNEGSSSQSSGFSVGAVVEGPNGKSTLSQTSSKSLASDARDTITFSTKINTYNGGSFKIKAYTALSTDGNHLNDTATTTLNFIAVPANPTTKDVAHCGNGKVTLNGSTTSGNTIQWYTASTGGTSFTTGSSFTTPTLNATATYYISAKNASGCESQRVMVKAIVNPAPTGSSVAAGTVFNGTANTGTQADPDITCPGKLLTYEVTPPTGYLNSDYNTTWTYSFTAKTANGTTANTTSNTSPTASANGIINFTPAFANSDSTIILAVTVKDMNTGCDSVMMRYIHILPAPKIAFTAADVCNGSAVTFMNNTTVSSGTLAYKWYFGDNTTSTDSAATHTYTTTGTYTVSLVATNTNGCKDSVTETVTVNPVPAAAFSAGNSCVRNNISFSNASTISSGTMSYMWTFGDGTTSTDENPTKAFSAAGTYGVKLVVSGAGGCKDSVTKNITINAVPQTGFTKGSVYNGVFNNGTA
ncbi:MAG: PKD domain-containing protein, partial [Sphingobacteriales bacterium]